MTSSAVSHIVENFGIFGFGTEEQAILQTAKELIENSLDAIRQFGEGGAVLFPRNISILLRSKDNDKVVLEVSDTGIGMDDPTFFLKCFSSSKSSLATSTSSSSSSFSSSSSSSLSGKFGMGLSASFLYSVLKTRMAMRITSKVLQHPFTVVMDFGIDEATGEPVLLQQEKIRQLQQHQLPSGTKISVTLPLVPMGNSSTTAAARGGGGGSGQGGGGGEGLDVAESERIIKNAVNAIDVLISRLDILPSASVSTRLDVDIGGGSGGDEFFPFSFSFNSQYDGRPPAAAARARESEQEWTTSLLGKVQECLDESSRCTAATRVASNEHSAELGALAVTCSAVFVFKVKQKGESFEDQYTGVLPLRLWRNFNSTPVLDTADDGR